jgi:elongator complex protein 1
VDLNLLVDFAWPRFLGRAEAFVRAVNDDLALCGLLAALRPGSVAAPGGAYASALPRPPPPPPADEAPAEVLNARPKIAGL